ncbi:MAG: hydroxyacid dehydrogenase, partial [Bauldia sp.]|uniref:hydroxyacid dehydrogenase n=1 Tax=Bauldia sp. TaxID=2575872 RepID=UPI001D494214
MPLVLLSGQIHDDGMAVFAERPDITLRDLEDADTATFVRELAEADALLIRTAQLPAEAIATADRLRVVSRHGVGYDNIPVDALTAKGVPLALAVGANAEAVAEHVFFLMLAIAKDGAANDRAVRDGNWQVRNSLTAFDLGGRTLLLVGFGRVGRAVARIARVFSMRVLAFDPMIAAGEMAAAGAEKVEDWRAVLPEVDVVSLHAPRMPETENMIAAAELEAMRSDAILINTSRGGLVDEYALAGALREGQLAGAGIDTFLDEPPPGASPLLNCDRAILSPHVAGLTREA